MVSWTLFRTREDAGVSHSSLPIEVESAEGLISGNKVGSGNGGRMWGLAAVSVLLGATVGWASFSFPTQYKIGPEQDVKLVSLAASDPVQEYEPTNLKIPNYDKKEGIWCVGLNAVGFDLNPKARRSMSGASVPNHEALRYFHQQGSNCFRLAITWERLQLTNGSTDLDPVDGVDGVVEFVTKTLGAYIIIDPHNNEEGLQFNGKDVTRSDFVNLWKAITNKWGSNGKCIFGLYNEPRYGYEDGVTGYFDPNVLDRDGRVIEFWREWMQSGIDAIRALGSKNLILVPGLHWTGCADWSGNYWWGETIVDPDTGEERTNQGNSRLAALTDPENFIAYDVHQYMDPRYTGQEDGCRGHDLNFYCQDDPGCSGADQGLQTTINWAKYYKKKLFMTEIGSYPEAGTEDPCKAKMCNYLQQMHESGVFIGYTVWQFGCPQCDADQWSKKPLNLDWYRIAEFSNLTKCTDAGGGACPKPTCASSSNTVLPAATPQPPQKCSEPHEDCRTSLCCKDPLKTCFEKNEYWASCRLQCTLGEMDDRNETWACEALGHAPENVTAANGTTCVEPGEDCRSSLCCEDSAKTCFLKNEYWASCMDNCTRGEKDDSNETWDCTALGRVPVDCDTDTPCQNSTGSEGEDCIAEVTFQKACFKSMSSEGLTFPIKIIIAAVATGTTAITMHVF